MLLHFWLASRVAGLGVILQNCRHPLVCQRGFPALLAALTLSKVLEQPSASKYRSLRDCTMDQEDSENLCPAEGTPARPRVPQAKPGELLAECTPAPRPLQTRNAETVRAISPPGTVKQLCLSARCTCACAGLVLGVLSLATCSAMRHSKLLNA